MNRQGEAWLWPLLGMVAFLALARLLTLGAYPLMDTTEARYGEIARKMAELGDWTTPWFDYGVPFWGKPPLSFWLTAGSFKLLGVGEFAARLPQWIVGMLVAGLLWQWLSRRSRTEAAYAVVLLLGSALYVVAAGAVMTDMALGAGTMLAMRGFWLAMNGAPAERTREQWLFFAGIAVGLLAKGPVALVLTGLPIAVWTVATGNLRQAWRALPWSRGMAAVLALSLPWYLLAEMRTPGFLDYFLVGEHWLRFIIPGWKGDLYGSAHSFPRGTIWAFALAAALPWSIVLPAAYPFLRRAIPRAPARDGEAGWRLYLACWALAPCVFFSLAGNVLWTYVLPGLPALAALGAAWLAPLEAARVSRALLTGLALTILGLAVYLASVDFSARAERDTSKVLVAAYESLRIEGEPLIFLGRRPFSAAFYSAGKAELVRDPGKLLQRLKEGRVFVAAEAGTGERLPAEFRARLEHIRRYGRFDLYAAVAPPTGLPPVSRVRTERRSN